MPTRLSDNPSQSILDGIFTADGAMDDIRRRNEEIAKRSTVVQDIFAKQEEQAATMLNAQKTQGDASMVVLAAKEYANLETQNQVQALASKIGINPNGSADLLDKIADEYKASAINAIDRRKKLEQDLDVKFLDHPIDYIAAQINMENTVKSAEVAAARRGAAIQDMNSIQTLTQQLPGQMAALAKTKSDATVQATLIGAQAMITEKLAKTAIENADIDLKRVNALQTFDDKQLNNITTAMNLKYQDNSDKRGAQSLELQKAAAAQSAEEFEQRKKMQGIQYDALVLNLEKNKDDIAGMKDIVNTVRAGAKVMGITLPDDMPTSRILQMIQNKEGKMYDFYNAGINTLSADRPVISDDAGDAARMLMQHRGQLRPEQKVVGDFLRETWQHAASPAAATQGGYDINKKDQVLGAVRTQAITKASEQQGMIKTGDNTNIYAPPPLPTILEMPGVKGTKWFKEVMEPQMAGGGLKEFNPQQLIAMTSQAVKSGKLTSADAVYGLQNTFGAAAASNNATRNYRGFGLPEQGSFNTRIESGNGGDRKYNLMDPKDITRAMFNQEYRLGYGKFTD